MQRTPTYRSKKNWDDFSDILTAEDVASLLKVNVATVRKHAMAGKLPGIHLGKEWRFDKTTLRAFLQLTAIEKFPSVKGA